jgi:hypothetical protein
MRKVHRGPKENKNYNLVQKKSRKNPGDKTGKAIGSGSFAVTSLHLSACRYHAARDRATWGEAPGANCTGAVGGPPSWHLGLEVDVDSQSPAGENRHRRRRREWSPNDHFARLSMSNRRGRTPRSSYRRRSACKSTKTRSPIPFSPPW